MSFIPGLQTLVDKVPELTTPRGLLRAILTPIVVLIVVLYVLLWLEAGSPLAALVLQLVVYGALHWLVRAYFGGREERVAYNEAFFNRFLPAAGLNLASMIYVLLARAPSGADTVRVIPVAIGWLLALYLLASAVMLAWRGVQTAGVDTIGGVYVYHPDEGQQLDHAIYGVLRHPLYAALDRMVLAFGLINGTAFGLLLALLFVNVWHPLWVGLEEDELLERLGEEYRQYRDRVPALVPHLPSGELAMWEALTRRDASP